MMGIMRHPRASTLNAVFASNLLPTHIVPPNNIFRRIVDCPSSLILSPIAHSSHPADALSSSSHEPSDAALMSLPSRNRSISKSMPSLSGGKSVSIRWKACCCICVSATTRCIFALMNASNDANVYCCILSLIICASSLILCGVSTSGILLRSATLNVNYSMLPGELNVLPPSSSK